MDDRENMIFWTKQVQKDCERILSGLKRKRIKLYVLMSAYIIGIFGIFYNINIPIIAKAAITFVLAALYIYFIGYKIIDYYNKIEIRTKRVRERMEKLEDVLNRIDVIDDEMKEEFSTVIELAMVLSLM